MTNSSNNDLNLISKISAHDAEIGMIRTDLDGLKGTVSGLQIAMQKGFKEISSQIAASKATNWGWWVAGASLLVLVSSLIVNDINKDIRDVKNYILDENERSLVLQRELGKTEATLVFLKEEQDRLRSYINNHEDGHPHTVLNELRGVEKIVEKLAQDLINVQQNRFTDKDGEKLENRIKDIEHRD